jgi:hypothetical protein
MSRRFIRSWFQVAAAILLLFAPLAWAFASPDEEGDIQEAAEYQTKAEFLFSFAKFVDWPQHKFTEPDSPLVIGIVGEDPFGGLLEEAVQDQRINDRTVVVKHVEDIEELRKCHIIFICRSVEGSRLGSILAQVRGDNVLTVGESDGFISRGGIINFVMDGNRVRFEINDSGAKHAGLKISSQLLGKGVPSSR